MSVLCASRLYRSICVKCNVPSAPGVFLPVFLRHEAFTVFCFASGAVDREVRVSVSCVSRLPPVSLNRCIHTESRWTGTTFSTVSCPLGTRKPHQCSGSQPFQTHRYTAARLLLNAASARMLRVSYGVV